MAVIFNNTKCEDCIHGAICVKKNDFENLIEQINNASITVVDHNDKSIGLVPIINNERYSAHISIECDYFIKERDHYTPINGVLLCEKNGVNE